METETTNRSRILELAWQLHAEMHLATDQRTKGFYDIRKVIIGLGVLTTLLAILIDRRLFSEMSQTLQVGVDYLFIAIPMFTSILAVFATRFYANGSELIFRYGVNEVEKEIYIYRTILPKDKTRREYLEKRLSEIQRKLLRSLDGEFAFADYKGSLPFSYNSHNPNSDPGFHDLSGDEYVRYRLKNQLDWHNNRINQYQHDRRWMAIYILAVGGLGTILAARGGTLAIWVALTSSVTVALLGWQELRKADDTIKNYSKVLIELSILYNHWQNLESEERTAAEFEKLVLGCERVLWTQNSEGIRSMQEALREADLEKDAAIINDTLKKSVESAERSKEMMYAFAVDTEQKLDTIGSLAEEASSDLVQKELEAMGRAINERVEDEKE